MGWYGGGDGHYSKYTQQVSFREPGQTDGRTDKPKAICSPLFQSWGHKKWLRQKWAEIIASKQRCDKNRSLSLTPTSIVYERLTSLKDRRLQTTNHVWVFREALRATSDSLKHGRQAGGGGRLAAYNKAKCSCTIHHAKREAEKVALDKIGPRMLGIYIDMPSQYCVTLRISWWKTVENDTV